MSKIETTHPGAVRDDEKAPSQETKILTGLPIKGVVDHLVKTTREMLKRHDIEDV